MANDAKIEARAEALEVVLDTLLRVQIDLEALTARAPGIYHKEETARLARDLQAARTLMGSVLADCAISARARR